MRKIFCLCLIFITSHSFAQKIFNQSNAKGSWQYVYPFKNTSYVLALQCLTTEKEPFSELCNTILYFGKTGVKTDKIFWKENIEMRHIADNLKYEDFNNDGVKDLLIFEDTGARGGNSFYNLYLINRKKYTLTKVKNFDKIVNPSYDKKHGVIISYGFTGTNYYQLYRLDKNYKPYKTGDSFDDKENLDLDKKITAILNKK